MACAGRCSAPAWHVSSCAECAQLARGRWGPQSQALTAVPSLPSATTRRHPGPLTLRAAHAPASSPPRPTASWTLTVWDGSVPGMEDDVGAGQGRARRCGRRGLAPEPLQALPLLSTITARWPVWRSAGYENLKESRKSPAPPVLLCCPAGRERQGRPMGIPFRTCRA